MRISYFFVTNRVWVVDSVCVFDTEVVYMGMSTSVSTKYQHFSGIINLIPMGGVLWHHYWCIYWYPCIHLYISPMLVCTSCNLYMRIYDSTIFTPPFTCYHKNIHRRKIDCTVQASFDAMSNSIHCRLYLQNREHHLQNSALSTLTIMKQSVNRIPHLCYNFSTYRISSSARSHNEP